MTTKEHAVDLITQRQLSNRQIAQAVGVDEKTIRRWRREVQGPDDITQREVEETGTSLNVRFTSARPIRTKEEAAEMAGVDLAQWTVVSVKTKAYQSAMKVKDGDTERPHVQQLWGITVIFAPRTGPDTKEQIDALVDGVLKAKKHAPREPLSNTYKFTKHFTQQQIVIADPHLSKLCWPKSTGGEAYDIDIAQKLVFGGVKYLVEQTPTCSSRVIAFLGDYFHYDTLQGTTTAGTLQDRDSRLPKMLEAGADLAVRAILHASLHGEVKVILVPGNHDSVLTLALQRILIAEFKRTDNVTIDDTYTKRKVHTFGKNLFLYDHGDRRKKELAASLAIEHPQLWGESLYREIHTGHLHQEIEQFHGTRTHHGALIYTHPSMSPPDQWHADELYVGATRGMKSFTYDIGGGQIASHTATPRLLLS